MDDLFALSRKAGAPSFMAAENFIQARFEDLEIEASVTADGERLVVNGQVWFLRGVEPNAALLGGKRNLGTGRARYNLICGSLGGRSTETLLKEPAFRIGQTVDTNVWAWTLLLANCHINDCRPEQRICRGAGGLGTMRPHLGCFADRYSIN
jgi:hypothetical protein